MRIRYPSSFLKLLLIGFAFAILPLLWAFANANIAFGKLAKQSEITISNAVETTRVSKALQEQLSLMERSARQYHVLNDNVLFSNYEQANTEFAAAIKRLLQLTKDAPLSKKLGTLNQNRERLHRAILKTKNKQVDDLTFLDAFNQLTIQIAPIIKDNNEVIDQASSQLTLEAEKMQKSLLLQSLVLIPLALLIAGIIAFLLARPIRRMDSAIRSLGEGQYAAPIAIDGPGDLHTLGQRLDWLRIELKDINEQKQQFLRHVSHELKTPLTAIREASELLHDGVGGILSKQQAEILMILRDNSVRLQKMIENLLNYTRLEAIQPSSNITKLNLADILNKVLKAHALSINNKNITVNTIINTNELIEANEDKLTIIFDNLISNAIKYSPDSGQIEINVNDEKKWLKIEVIDNGPGLAKADVDNIFDPFYRGNTIHNGLINGSGLGLTIIKELIEKLGGSIKLKPSTMGAHFVVHLPTTDTNTMETA